MDNNNLYGQGEQNTDQSQQPVYNQGQQAVYNQEQQSMYNQGQQSGYNQEQQSAYNQGQQSIYNQGQQPVYGQGYQQSVYNQGYQQPYQQSYQMDSELEEPVSFGDWMLSMLVMMIPCVNLIMMFVWAFGSGTKKSKSNYFKAALVWTLIWFVLWIIMMIGIGQTFASIANYY